MSFFGFLSGCEDHTTQENCCRRCPQTTVIDLFRDAAPAYGENGTDNTGAFAREACAIVRSYAAHRDRQAQERQPLFLYLALQDVHSPFQVERRFEAIHQSTWRHFNIWAGMVSAVDETVHNLTQQVSRLKFDCPHALSCGASPMFPCCPRLAALASKDVVANALLIHERQRLAGWL